ncbi:MAG: hypothetical protein QOH56_4115 [Pseudonocardiales bacterium]|nr:hypothetical protein [Pseudonocardiales bacterium]
MRGLNRLPALLSQALGRLRSAFARRQRMGRHPPADPSASPEARGDGFPTADIAGVLDFLIGHPLRQPDRTTCGSAALVVAQMLVRPTVAATILGDHHAAGAQRRFAVAARRMHRRTSGLLDADRKLQLPWPPELGTLPWSAARQMSSRGGRYTATVVDPHRRRVAFDAVAGAVAAGYPCLLYVGDGFSPRHVVLAVGSSPAGMRIYEPSSGGIQGLTRESFSGAAPFEVAGWDQPWVVVLPRTPIV